MLISQMPHRLHLHDRLDVIGSKSEEWSGFSRACGLAAPFCEARVWTTWLEAHPRDQPAVYEWFSDANRRALLPFYRRGRRLEMATGPHLDYQDFAATDLESATLALRAVLAAERTRSGMIVFPKVAARSRLSEVLDDPGIAEIAHRERRFWSQCPVVSIPKEPGREFLASIPARQRKDFRNASRRLREALPGLVVEHHGPGRFPPRLIEEAALLHHRNQYRKEGPSICEDPAYVGFLKELAASETALCLSLLRAAPEEPPIAFVLGWFAADTFHYYLTSYAGEQARLSPGRWLLVETLRHWHERAGGPALRFDMLCGEEEYKSRWPSVPYEVARVVLIPRRIANLPRILAYSAVYGLKNAKNRSLLNRPGHRRLHDPEAEEIVLPG